MTYLLSPTSILTYIILEDTSFHSVTCFINSSLTIIPTSSLAHPLLTPDILPTYLLKLHYPLLLNFVSVITNTPKPLSSNILHTHSRFSGSLQPCTFIQAILIIIFRLLGRIITGD